MWARKNQQEETADCRRNPALPHKRDCIEIGGIVLVKLQGEKKI